MANLFQFILVVAGLAAAAAVSAVCVLGLVVWMAGGKTVARK